MIVANEIKNDISKLLCNSHINWLDSKWTSSFESKWIDSNFVTYRLHSNMNRTSYISSAWIKYSR